MEIIVVLVIVGGLSYGLASNLAFQKGFIDASPTGFFGRDSWKRKYKLDHLDNPVNSENTFYTKLFNLKYKERFPLSATLLVFLTDGFHFFQFLAIQSLMTVVALSTEYYFLTTWFLLNCVWKFGFWVTYYELPKIIK